MIDEGKLLSDIDSELRWASYKFSEPDLGWRMFNYGIHEGLMWARKIITDQKLREGIPTPQDVQEGKLPGSAKTTCQTCGTCVSETDKEEAQDAERP